MIAEVTWVGDRPRHQALNDIDKHNMDILAVDGEPGMSRSGEFMVGLPLKKNPAKYVGLWYVKGA